MKYAAIRRWLHARGRKQHRMLLAVLRKEDRRFYRVLLNWQTRREMSMTKRACVDCGLDTGDTDAYRCEPCHIAWKHVHQADLIERDPSYCYCDMHRA